MKKLKLLTLITLASISVIAQEKGSYVGISGAIGGAGLNFDYKGISAYSSNNFKLGGHINADYTYYFTKNWGASIGLGSSLHRTTAKINEADNGKFFSLGNQIDNDPNFGETKDFELRARLMDWKEEQKAYFIDIPLLAKYQTKLGKTKRHGMYFGIGAKIQIPVKATYKTVDSDFEDEKILNISGYYESINMELGHGSEVIKHGFGTIHNPNSALGWNGKLNLRPSFTGLVEVGALIGLARRVDLLIGAYFDYGFNNIKKKKSSKTILEAPADYLPNAEYNIGNGIKYNGFINSNGTERVNLMSYGIKIGVRIKLGDLYEDDPFDEKTYEVNNYTIIRDTCCGGTRSQSEDASLKNIENLIRELSESQKETDNIESGFVIKTVSNTPSQSTNIGSDDILLERIYFDFNTTNIRESEIPALDRKFDFLRKDESINIKIIGNTCSLAGEDINMVLGHQRAESVKKYLVDKGISADRIATSSNGKDNPLLPNNTLENRKINRRCDFEIWIKK